MTVFLSLFVAALGLIIYFVATTNAKLAEVGRILLWTGLLAFLLTFGPRAINFFR